MQDRCLLYAAMEIKKKGSQKKQTNTKTSQAGTARTAGTSLIDFNRTMGVAGRCSMFMFMLEDVSDVSRQLSVVHLKARDKLKGNAFEL